MSSGSTIKFELSLRLPRVAEIASMSPSSYWGITVAKDKSTRDPFADADKESFVDGLVDSARRATKEAVAATHAQGRDTPGGREGKVVFLTPSGKIKPAP